MMKAATLELARPGTDGPRRGETAMAAKWMANVSKACPFCIIKRKNPDSGYAKFMHKVEKACPFCQAYEEHYGQEQQPRPEPETPASPGPPQA
jgi:hypothetical protein